MLPALLLAIAYVLALHWGLTHLPLGPDASRVVSIVCAVLVLVLAILGLWGMVSGPMHFGST